MSTVRWPWTRWRGRARSSSWPTRRRRPASWLPTSGTARFASGLSANDFLRRSSVLAFSPAGLQRLSGDVLTLARKEGLTAHAASVEIRLPPRDDRPEARAKKTEERKPAFR